MHFINRQRMNQMHPLAAAQEFFRRVPYIRAQMHRVYKMHIRIFLRQPRYRTANVFHGLPIVLPAVRCDQYYTVSLKIQTLQRFILKFKIRFHRQLNCIYYRIPANRYAVRYLLPRKVLPVALCRRKMQRRNLSHQPPVHFLRERRIFIIRAQPCLHVSNRDLMVKRSKRPRKCGRGITMHQHNIRRSLFQHAVQTMQRFLRNGRQRLALLHNI